MESATNKPSTDSTYAPLPGMPPCMDETCLLWFTPRVGFTDLAPKSMEESLLGVTEAGQEYKLGRGKVTKGNVAAAKKLLEREYPQVRSQNQAEKSCFY